MKMSADCDKKVEQFQLWVDDLRDNNKQLNKFIKDLRYENDDLNCENDKLKALAEKI